MLRILDDLLNRSDVHQLAGVHHAYSVGELRHETHIVPDENHRRASVALNATQRHHHLSLHHNIQGTGRFVGHDHLRIHARTCRDGHSLLHPAAQLVREHPCNAVSQTHTSEKAVNMGPHVLLRVLDSMIDQPVENLIFNAHHRVESIHCRLRNKCDFSQPRQAHLFIVQGDQITTVDKNLTIINVTGWFRKF